MKDKSSTVCREIVNTSEVLQTKLTESVVTHLVSTGKIDNKTGKEISQFFKREVHIQLNSLVDRVLNVMSK